MSNGVMRWVYGDGEIYGVYSSSSLRTCCMIDTLLMTTLWVVNTPLYISYIRSEKTYYILYLESHD